MIILITGDRNWSNENIIKQALIKYTRKGDTIIHGAAKGADSIAGRIGRDELKLEVKPYPADWTKYGRAAGPIRNRFMLQDNPNIELILAFHPDITKSKGTKDMINCAKKLLLPIVLFDGITETILCGEILVR